MAFRAQFKPILSETNGSSTRRRKPPKYVKILEKKIQQNFSKKFEDKSAPNLISKNRHETTSYACTTRWNSMFEARGWKKASWKTLIELHKPNWWCWSPQIEANHPLQSMCENKHYARVFLSSFSFNIDNYKEQYLACYLHTSKAMCKARLESCLGKEQPPSRHHKHYKTPN